jgi:hypothetical protein
MFLPEMIRMSLDYLLVGVEESKKNVNGKGVGFAKNGRSLDFGKIGMKKICV